MILQISKPLPVQRVRQDWLIVWSFRNKICPIYLIISSTTFWGTLPEPVNDICNGEGLWIWQETICRAANKFYLRNNDLEDGQSCFSAHYGEARAGTISSQPMNWSTPNLLKFYKNMWPKQCGCLSCKPNNPDFYTEGRRLSVHLLKGNHSFT